MNHKLRCILWAIGALSAIVIDVALSVSGYPWVVFIFAPIASACFIKFDDEIRYL